jgi:hypothetical protein
MVLLRCTVCFRSPPEGQKPENAFEQIHWLGFAKRDKQGRYRRQVIHLPCHRRWWTNYPAVLDFCLYSLRDRKLVPRGTRLDEGELL